MGDVKIASREPQGHKFTTFTYIANSRFNRFELTGGPTERVLCI